MAEQKDETKEQAGQRVKVEDLKQPAQELSAEEQKKVQGGSRYAFAGVDRKETADTAGDGNP